MADPIDPTSRRSRGLITVLPESVTGPTPQNPAPFDQEGQVDQSRVRAVADQIVRVFLNSLPSNYVSQVKGPSYVQEFQAAAEELARIQVSTEDAYEDIDYDFTRTEVLFQFLADLIFPTSETTGLPEIRGDLSYRAFLKKMVALLLQGSRNVTLVSGVEALTDAEVSILEKVDWIGKPGVGWTALDRFTFEINVSKHRRTLGPDGQVQDHYHTVEINASGEGTTTETIWSSGTGPDHTHTISDFLVAEASATGLPPHTHDLLSDFPDLPIALERNVRIVMRALRPAYTLYDYRNLFRETFRHVFTDVFSQFDLDTYYYDDFRKFCGGTKELSSTTGEVLGDRYTLNDVLSFRGIRPGAPLVISSGSNAGRYEVRGVASFPFGNDPVARPYTTSPSSLSGSATVVDGAFVDAAQDWALAAPNEVLTFTNGPNAGRYLLETVLGANGGPVGEAAGPATSVRPAVCFLQIRGPRFPFAATAVPYTVEVDRLGVRTSRTVTDEDVSLQFYAPPSGTTTTFQTARGPLVRPWGDGTPATTADVTVLYDGAPVSVGSVNPYTGEVTLASPITRFLPGAHTVTVSYHWFPGPLVGFAGLNRPGLTLNRWSLGGGRNSTSPSPSPPGGGSPTGRFPLSVGLGLSPRAKPPLRVAHRYIAFERAYTAALNSPTTLLLNQSPGRISVPYAETNVESATVQYEGTAAPVSPWVSKGVVSGSSSGDLYRLSDVSDTSVGYWNRDFLLSVSSMVGTAARFQIQSFTLDGVFTGVGFGFHNDRRLYLAGALVVNGLKHVGLLARPGELRELNSWIVGPRATGTISSATVVTCGLEEAPRLLREGDRFQILTGSQAGLYTVSSVFFDRERSLATITVEGPGFPANPALFGNRTADLVFETKWDEGLCTWRMYASTRDDSVQLLFGGATGGSLVTLTAGPVLASPAYLGPDVLPAGAGRYLWGSFSRRATNTTDWDFLRYLSTPDGGTKFSRGTVVDTTMGEDPEDEQWWRTTPYGDASASGGLLRITGTPANGSYDTQFGYGYVDPFLNGRRVVAIDGRFSVQRDTSGAGGAAMSLRDTHREARLGNLLYQDNGPDGKVIYSRTSVSLIGAVDYETQGWAASLPDATFGTPVTFANGPEMLIGGRGEENWLISRSLPGTLLTFDRIAEFRLAIGSYTLGTSLGIGLTFLISVSDRLVGVSFSGPDVVNLTDVTLGPVVSAAVDWSDGAARTYRVEVSPLGNLVELYVDNVLLTSAPYLSFPNIPSPNDGLSLGFLAEEGAEFEAALSSLCLMEGVDGIPDLHRTFGLWKGGDFANLDNWEIPRTDGLPVPNSDPSSAIVEMDWTVECWTRLFVDPTYGAVFLRPDLPPPSGYSGNFATQSLDPTAAWAKIEYAWLPRAVTETRFGVVAFGKLNPASSSLQTWNEVRYRVFTHVSVDYRAPQKMVLNQRNVITSGDYLKDFTPESVVVASLSPTRVSLRPAHIFANRVFQVIVEGIPRAPESYRFNVDSQEITLFDALPSTGYPVTVVFAVGKPVTTTYLLSQPIPESQTILNEGTPPVPRGQVGRATVTTVSGDGGPTPAFPPAGPGDPQYFLRDQYLVREFSDDPEVLYEKMDFFQLEDGGETGKISTFCDGYGNGGSVSELGLEGTLFSENMSPVTNPFASNFNRGAGRFGPMLSASGGGFVGGLLGPAVYTTPFSGPNPTPTGLRYAILTPTAPASTVPGAGGGAADQEVTMVLRLGSSPGSVLISVSPPVDVPLTEGTEDDPILSPDSDRDTPTYRMQGVAMGYTRVGPWVGGSALALNSRLYGSSSLQPTGVPPSGTGMIPVGGIPLPTPPVPVAGTM